MNRKAVIASLDAMIFVTLLAVAASAMIVFVPQEDGAPDASEICNNLNYVILDGDAVAGESVRSDITFWDYAACMISAGRTAELESYIAELMDDLVSGRYGYGMELTHGGSTVTVGRGNGTPSSDCNLEILTYDGTVLGVRLTVYAQR